MYKCDYCRKSSFPHEPLAHVRSGRDILKSCPSCVDNARKGESTQVTAAARKSRGRKASRLVTERFYQMYSPPRGLRNIGVHEDYDPKKVNISRYMPWQNRGK